MAVPVVRHPPQNNESATRLKRAPEDEEERNALVPGPPSAEVRMNIPRGMPVLPGGRRMPPLPVLWRESLAPLRRSLAPLRRSLAPLWGDADSPDAGVRSTPRRRRWPLAVALLVALAAGGLVYVWLRAQ